MSKKFVLIITHSNDDQDRANAAVALAVSLLSEDADLVIFYIFRARTSQKKVWLRPLKAEISHLSVTCSRWCLKKKYRCFSAAPVPRHTTFPRMILLKV